MRTLEKRVAALERQIPIVIVEPPEDHEAMLAQIYKKLFAPIPDGFVVPVAQRSDHPAAVMLRQKLLRDE